MSIEMVRSLLLGIALGEALSVPEGRLAFDERQGSWGDDAALSFCLAEMLTGEWNLNYLAELFIKWKEEGYWTAHGKTFTQGRASAFAIERLKIMKENPTEAGLRREKDNGNGALVRMLPLIFALRDKGLKEREEMTRAVASLTHAHMRSLLACNFIIEFTLCIYKGSTMSRAYERTRKAFAQRYAKEKEIKHFARILKGNLASVSSKDINASAYVIDSLELALWSLLSTDSFQSACLAGLKLGGKKSCGLSIVGGVATLAYGAEGIPEEWLEPLARRADIEDLAFRLAVAQRPRLK